MAIPFQKIAVFQSPVFDIFPKKPKKQNMNSNRKISFTNAAVLELGIILVHVDQFDVLPVHLRQTCKQYRQYSLVRTIVISIQYIVLIMEEGEGFGTNFYSLIRISFLLATYQIEPLFWSTFDSWFPGIVLSASGPLAPHDSHFVMQGFVTWVFSWSSYL